MSSVGGSEIGSHVRLYLDRLPKKNHEAMMQLSNQFADMFRNYGIYARSFQLESSATSEGFNNLISYDDYTLQHNLLIQPGVETSCHPNVGLWPVI